MKEIKRRLVTHKDCLDGSCCAIVFLQLFPDAEVVYVQPNEVDSFPGRNDGSMTVFADVCPDSFLVDETVVDHHIGNIERIRGKEPEGAVLSVHGCGCMLLLETLFKQFSEEAGGDDRKLRSLENLQRLVHVVDDYDRWVLSRTTSPRLAALHQIMGQREFVREFSSRLDTPRWRWDEEMITNSDRTLLYYFSKMTERYVATCLNAAWTTPLSIGGRAAVVFGDSRHSNDVCHALLDNFPDVEFAVNLDLLRGTGSIRSRSEEHDCAAFARTMGGNGHRCAAGFPIPKGAMEEVRVVFGG